MSEHQDSGTIAEDEEKKIHPEEPEPKSKKKKEEAPSGILRCFNGCGFMTRYPKAQALDGNMCPMCDANGMSSKLVPYP